MERVMSVLETTAISRRRALKKVGLATASAWAVPMVMSVGRAQAPAPEGPHKLPPLGYALDALEPFVDAKTMEIHHGKHHAAYVSNLNKALTDYPDLQKLTIEELLKNLDKVPEKIRTTVRNSGGGHYNHSLFWKGLKKDAGSGPTGRCEEAFGDLFASREEGQEQLVKTAMSVFGSGWVWVSVDKDKRLKLEVTPNQDSPIMQGRTPLIGVDLWEHAYYLKYQNRRMDYLTAILNIINWEFVNERFEKLTA